MFVDSLYTILVFTSIIITLIFGFALLFIKVPQNPNLKSYRLFRIVMACTYLSLCAANVSEFIMQGEEVDIQFTRCITLLVSALQAFLLTYSYIALLEPRYITWKRVMYNLIHILIIGIAVFFAYSYSDNFRYFDIAYSFGTIYYVFLLVWYTYLFVNIYKRYQHKSDNYFSEMEAKRMQWTYLSFWASLLVGISSLISVIFIGSMLAAIIFMFFVCLFYAYYGIRFINYGFQFQFIEPIVTGEDESPVKSTVEENDQNTNTLQPKVQLWIEEEKYLQQGLTIEQLARDLSTNRTYVSNYINNVEKKTFREWINYLRIEKAKELLLSQPLVSIAEIANMTGYNDGSNFNKQFVKNTGTTAQVWRKENS